MLKIHCCYYLGHVDETSFIFYSHVKFFLQSDGQLKHLLFKDFHALHCTQQKQITVTFQGSDWSIHKKNVRVQFTKEGLIFSETVWPVKFYGKLLYIQRGGLAHSDYATSYYKDVHLYAQTLSSFRLYDSLLAQCAERSKRSQIMNGKKIAKKGNWMGARIVKFN